MSQGLATKTVAESPLPVKEITVAGGYSTIDLLYLILIELRTLTMQIATLQGSSAIPADPDGIRASIFSDLK